MNKTTITLWDCTIITDTRRREGPEYRGLCIGGVLWVDGAKSGELEVDMGGGGVLVVKDHNLYSTDELREIYKHPRIIKLILKLI